MAFAGFCGIITLIKNTTGLGLSGVSDEWLEDCVSSGTFLVYVGDNNTIIRDGS